MTARHDTRRPGCFAAACCLLSLALSAGACGSTSASSDSPSAAPTDPQPTASTHTTGQRPLPAPKAGASGSLPEGVSAGGPCPAPAPPDDAEIAEQAAAIVPLTTGLTLSHLWNKIDSAHDIECLTHVDQIDGAAVRATVSCLDASTPAASRRICRDDLRRARAYHPMTGRDVPERLVGANLNTLSRESFREVKGAGTTRHRHVEISERTQGHGVDVDLDGTLTLEGPGIVSAIVNDAPVDLPVLWLTGSLTGVHKGTPATASVVAAVLDDERFPLVLDYRLAFDIGDYPYSVRYARISYPTERAIEKGLAEHKSVDVYGLYFDFASDRIRKESDPILAEIAALLKRNPEWTLSIAGHTDNVGGEAANLDLSTRRSEAVRAALIDRFGIAGARLTAAGHGEGAPKDTNDTPDGRARNRRVELTRQ